jgi:hypothetical protein
MSESSNALGIIDGRDLTRAAVQMHVVPVGRWHSARVVGAEWGGVVAGGGAELGGAGGRRRVRATEPAPPFTSASALSNKKKPAGLRPAGLRRRGSVARQNL